MRKIWWGNRLGGPWPVPDWLPHERVSIEGNTGATLAGRYFPVARPRGVVVLAHPDLRYGQHWFVQSGWVDFLHDAGFDALTFDFAGYGESRGGSTYFMADVVGAAQFARRRAGGRPVHVVGVSMGAFAAANASPRLDFVDALVLESPYPSFNAWYGRGTRKAAMGIFDRVFPRTAALLRADRNLAHAKPRRILVVAAAHDDVTPARLSQTVARAGPPDRTRYLEVARARHLEPFGTSAEYRDRVLQVLQPLPSEPMEGREPVPLPMVDWRGGHRVLARRAGPATHRRARSSTVRGRPRAWRPVR